MPCQTLAARPGCSPGLRSPEAAEAYDDGPSVVRVEIEPVYKVEDGLALLDHAERYMSDPSDANRAALRTFAGRVHLGLAAVLVARATR